MQIFGQLQVDVSINQKVQYLRGIWLTKFDIILNLEKVNGKIPFFGNHDLHGLMNEHFAVATWII